MTNGTEDRIAALERRLGAAEDEIAIIRLVASYGPFVDSGSTDLAPGLMAPDGVYDLSYGRMTGRDAFSALLRGEDHRAVLRGGIAHVMGLPWVRVSGDSATAINCTQLYIKSDAGFSVFRVAQNVWTLRRTGEGWEITERINRLIGEGDEARALLESNMPAHAKSAG